VRATYRHLPTLTPPESQVTDFGLSKLLPAEQQAEGAAGSSVISTAGPNNPIWLAPEIMRGGKFTAASDVYAFGLIMYELLTWQLPWGGAGIYEIVQIVLNGGRPEVPPLERLPGPDAPPPAALDQYCRLMRECWNQEAVGRPTFAEVVPRLRALLAAAGPSNA